jgi:hypothetical protein
MSKGTIMQDEKENILSKLQSRVTAGLQFLPENRTLLIRL